MGPGASRGLFFWVLHYGSRAVLIQLPMHLAVVSPPMQVALQGGKIPNKARSPRVDGRAEDL
jgi:hypothetical protein